MRSFETKYSYSLFLYNRHDVFRLLFYFVAAVSFIPFAITGRDLWDGVIIANSIESNRMDVIWNWFTESGWFLVPFLYEFVYILSDYVQAYECMVCLMVIFHILAADQIYKIGKNVFSLYSSSSIYASLIFLASPVWSIYASSVFLMHSFTLALSLLCVNKIVVYGYRKALPYVFLSLITFQQASLPILVLSLLSIDLLLNVQKNTTSNFKFSWEKSKVYGFSFYLTLVVIYFFAARYFFPAHGLYAGYNAISPAKIFNLSVYSLFAKFVFHLYPYLFLSFLLFFLLQTKKERVKAIVCVFAVAVNTIPFVIVNKPPWISHLYAIQGWDHRQAITIVVVLSILFGIMANTFFKSSSKHRWLLLVFMAFYLGNSVKNYYFSFDIKLKSALLQTQIEESLMGLAENIGSCGIEFYYKTSWNFKDLSQYELAYAAKKAFGENHYIFNAGRPTNIPSKEIYRKKYMIPDEMPSCIKTVYLDTNMNDYFYYPFWMFSKKHEFQLTIK